MRFKLGIVGFCEGDVCGCCCCVVVDFCCGCEGAEDADDDVDVVDAGEDAGESSFCD